MEVLFGEEKKQKPAPDSDSEGIKVSPRNGKEVTLLLNGFELCCQCQGAAGAAGTVVSAGPGPRLEEEVDREHYFWRISLVRKLKTHRTPKNPEQGKKGKEKRQMKGLNWRKARARMALEIFGWTRFENQLSAGFSRRTAGVCLVALISLSLAPWKARL